MEDLLYVGAGVFFDLKSYGKLAIAISYRTCQSNIPVTCNVTRHHAPASNVVIGTCAAGDEIALESSSQARLFDPPRCIYVAHA
jgi:hypothetical protein